jgi:hypothetical protein
MNKAGKIVLLLCIIFLPFSIFYFFSLGEHHFEKLPFLGPEKNGSPFRYESRKITSVTGVDLTDTLKGKTLIVTSLNPAYSNGAGFYIGAFKQVVMQELYSNKKYKNVVIVSEVHNSNDSTAKLLYNKYQIPGKWYVCFAPEPSFFDVENEEGNLMELKDPTFKERKLFERLVLIIDRNGHWRACHDLTEGIKSKTLIDELRLLMKEYFKDYGAY